MVSSACGRSRAVTTQLPGSGIGDIGYGYSPDGSRILYAQFDSNDHGTLFSVKTDGSDPIQLSPPELSVVDLGFFDRVGADWSPDGSRDAFAALNGSNHFITAALYVVNADGTGLHQIMPPGLGALSAQWSPNGAQIAFTSCPSRSLRTFGVPQAWVVRPDGSGLRQITPLVSGALFFTPVWSPDSTKLVLNRFDQATGQTSLWTVNVNGSGLFKLADTVMLSQIDWGSAPPN
jgi:TolB protein